ncbi:Uncharacterised protein [Amycolatopsis camponoti]|uniref:Uncharacterized protein n=1 Tax=Amycolatopsis camponoti TaxID=2606593 RepID=A0A6I8LWB5_9PSEU|nr:Uncharacterised protein [Amycolatopsis camponoti]
MAAGGAGKTVAFTEFAKTEQDARLIDTAALTIEGLERELDDACFHESAVYLDGLDQAASVEPRLFPWLERYLTAAARRTMHWRLACRAAAWDAVLGRALFQELPTFTVWKLAPLDRGAAVSAIERTVNSPEFDSAAFMSALIEAKLGRLSGCVGQLIAVARYWNTQGELPRSASDAINFEIEHLLRETNERMRPLLPLDRSMRLAQRLGAFTTFAGNQALTVAAVGDRATLPVSELPSDAEPDQPARTVEPADYRAVLDTALFDSGPPGSVVFRHQRYLEYLAAAYLVERGIRAGQIPVLLGVHANGLLPTARIGIASWLAALAPDLVAGLIAGNAAMFASTAAVVELPSDEVRAAVVKGLLEAAARDDVEPDWRLDRAGLLHAGLAEQLAEYLQLGPANDAQLWWIARLAAAGGCRAAAPALARAALESEWFGYARRAAVAAVAEMGEEDTLLVLRELLLVPADADPDADNEVRAAVIDALYPRLLNTAELTQALRPHRSILYGGYRQTLRDLPGRVPAHDLAEFVAWLADHAWHSDVRDDDHFEDLYAGVIERAWQQVDDDAVRGGLARLIVALVRSGLWHRPSARIKRFPWADGAPEYRHALAVDAAAVGEETWYAVLTLGLLVNGDAGWLLDTLPSAPPQAAGVLTDCLPQLLHDPSAALVERILELAPDHPAYDATAFLRAEVRIDDESVQPQRHMAAEDHEYQREQLARQEQAREELRAVLTCFDTEPESWSRVPWLLAAGGGNHTDIDEATAPDLTRRTRWTELGAGERQLILAAGLVYLHTHRPAAQTWWTAKSWTSGTVSPDWSGVYLLATLVEHFPELLNELPDGVWARWASSIIATPAFGGDDAIEPRRRLLDAVPAAVRPRLIDAGVEHLAALDAAGDSLTPHAIYVHLICEIAPAVAERLLATSTETVLAGELLTLLVKHGPSETALDVCRRLIEARSPLARLAQAHLAELDPDTVIDALAAATPPPDELAEAVRNLNVALLDPAHLAVAARLLLDTHPYAEDPPLKSGFAYSPHHHASDVRRHVLERMALNGQSEELANLSVGRPETDQQAVAYHHRIARARQADLALGTTSPRSLLNLLRRGDARLVRDDADLQHVLLQQLDELQHYLAAAWREIWRGDRPRTEDDISDWLERRLGERLDGVIVDREIQVKRDRPGIGTRIDLTATTKTMGGDTARVLVEAKLVDNGELDTAMQAQLIDRYLVPLKRRYGIYLVYWITPTQRPDGWSKTKAADKVALERDLAGQARRAAEAGFRIAPYVLDISRPLG